MEQRYNKYSHKRRLLQAPASEDTALLLARIGYGGNPEHKRNPGDFGLTPPAGPRQGKSLCDDAAVFRRATALELLRDGVRCGLISDRREGPWPKNIWSVTLDGRPLEAQLENPTTGTYHGYPMPDTDPFHTTVLSHWRRHHGAGRDDGD